MKKAIVFGLTCIGLPFVLLSSGCSSTGDAEQDHVMERVLTISTGPDNPRNSEGDFITLANGRIYYVYTRFTGDSYLDDAPAYLASRFSDDDGKTWSAEDVQVIAREGKANVMSVSLLRLQNGEIALFYLKKNAITDCKPMVRFSSDECATWTEPIACIPDQDGYFVVNNNRIVQLASGRLIMPVSQHLVKGNERWDEEEEMGHLYAYISDDNGKTWRAGNEVNNPNRVIHQEPGVVELTDGKLMMFIRTNAGVQYKSYSADEGENWSASEPSGLHSPQSPASIVQVPDSGKQLVVWNNNNGDNPIIKGKRTPLQLAVSEDNMVSWDNNLIIEDNPDGSFCYTAIHFTEKSVLLGYFDWATRAITITRISQSAIF